MDYAPRYREIEAVLRTRIARLRPGQRLPSDADLQRKFLWLTGPIIGNMQANDLIGKIWSADQWTSIDPIITGCRAATA